MDAVAEAGRLVALIRERQPCVALTGAGVSQESGIPTFRGPDPTKNRGQVALSTESGIPDFRSADGVWAKYDPMEYASIEAFRRDPVKVWEFYGRRLGALLEAKPNAAHGALVELERRGLLSAVITQNIDRLHSLAGSEDVVEVHGSIATSVCLRCGATATLEDVLALLDGAPAPACPSCGAILKPNVVMFGELLPAAAIDRAFELARSAGLLLVVGSTLEVYPVAGLPLETVGAGGALAIVNRGPTALDELATVRIDGTAGEVLGRVVEELD